MEDIVKLTSLSAKSWHYKLVKYTFNIEGKIFQNLCPYFWLVIASLLCCFFVFVIKQVVKLIEYIFSVIGNITFDNYGLSKKQEVEYNDWLKTLTPIQMFDYCYSDQKFKKNNKKHRKYNYNVPKVYEKKKDIFGDWCEVNNYTTYKFYENVKDDYYHVLDSIRDIELLEKEKVKQQREKAYSIIKKAKLFISLVIGLCLSCISFVFAALIIIFLTHTINAIYLNPVGMINASGIILLIITIICLIISLVNRFNYLYQLKDSNKFVWYDKLFFYPIYSIVWVFTDLLWKHIIVAFYKSIESAFILFGGIFAEYFGTAKGDYCPGIKWEEEND